MDDVKIETNVKMFDGKFYLSTRFGCVFVGAFSDFGGLVYRIPAPIFGGFGDFSSSPPQ
jgi:hypothetical protein